ncbi:hypothetical protein N007_19250 [Alicyclobacillus acidoterrestris ATCC 49025]|nr:hypothetical protein N007_19250 [Alicyclobacillus acidoterrestris ATCC 49025]
MNQADTLDVIWARKTAIQLLQLNGSHKISFVCPLCSGNAEMYFINHQYRSFCKSGCFSCIDIPAPKR